MDIQPVTEQTLAAADELLASRGIPATAREFRLRQEFFRFGWDMRVRDSGSGWIVRAVKAGRPNVDVNGSTESIALRCALADVLRHDADAAEHPES